MTMRRRSFIKGVAIGTLFAGSSLKGEMILKPVLRGNLHEAYLNRLKKITYNEERKSFSDVCMRWKNTFNELSTRRLLLSFLTDQTIRPTIIAMSAFIANQKISTFDNIERQHGIQISREYREA